MPNLLSPEECRQLVDLGERLGYGLAGARGVNLLARYALRALVDAPHLAEAIQARLAQLLPKEYRNQRLLRVNKRLRLLKYTKGMHHADHTDRAHEDEDGVSLLTVQLYLNDSFTGGRTTFISDRLVPIEVAPGTAVIFDHELYHRGEMVTSGTKHALRLDVCYGRGAVEAKRKARWSRG